jgi:cytochrome c-type biogenesis protein CcmH/NrfG
LGSPIAAYDLLADALVQFPSDVRLRQLLALALARSGASNAAIPLLETLLGEGQADEETLGLLARATRTSGR